MKTAVPNGTQYRKLLIQPPLTSFNKSVRMGEENNHSFKSGSVATNGNFLLVVWFG